MKISLVKALALPVVVFGAGLALSSVPARAMAPLAAAANVLDAPIVHVAHAGAPYKNVDKRNDAGNDTGDSQVDKLNDQSLQRARSGQ